MRITGGDISAIRCDLPRASPRSNRRISTPSSRLVLHRRSSAWRGLITRSVMATVAVTLRVPVALESTIFEVRISCQSPEYLIDHQVQGSPVLPGAASVEQALAAAEQCFGPGRHAVADLSFQQAMFLPPGSARAIQIALGAEQGGERTIEVSSLAADAEPDERWTLHACGRLRQAETIATERP